MKGNKRKISASKKRKVKTPKPPTEGHKRRFNQLLDDAVLGVKK